LRRRRPRFAPCHVDGVAGHRLQADAFVPQGGLQALDFRDRVQPGIEADDRARAQRRGQPVGELGLRYLGDLTGVGGLPAGAPGE
jgi:hypothetical protein